MSNLLVRSITGIFFVTALLVPLFLEEKLIGVGVFTLFFVLGIIEFFKLFNNSENVQINWQLASFVGVLNFGLLTASLLGFVPQFLLFALFPISFLWMVSELFYTHGKAIGNIGIKMTSYFYLVLPFLTLILIHIYPSIPSEVESSFPLLAGMLLLIWTNDTFAYLTGRMLGKTKLFERISPKKTWEGTIGGIIFTIVVGIIIAYFTNHEYLFWSIAAVLMAPCAIFGDLLESLFKRSLNVKDSGTILPGHGGILDRFDATLMAAPFFYVWLLIYTYFS